MFPIMEKLTWGHRWSRSKGRINLIASQVIRRFILTCTLPLEVALQQTPPTSTSSWGTKCLVIVMEHSSTWPWTPIRWMSKSASLLLQVVVSSIPLLHLFPSPPSSPATRGPGRRSPDSPGSLLGLAGPPVHLLDAVAPWPSTSAQVPPTTRPLTRTCWATGTALLWKPSWSPSGKSWIRNVSLLPPTSCVACCNPSVSMMRSFGPVETSVNNLSTLVTSSSQKTFVSASNAQSFLFSRRKVQCWKIRTKDFLMEFYFQIMTRKKRKKVIKEFAVKDNSYQIVLILHAHSIKLCIKFSLKVCIFYSVFWKAFHEIPTCRKRWGNNCWGFAFEKIH